MHSYEAHINLAGKIFPSTIYRVKAMSYYIEH